MVCSDAVLLAYRPNSKSQSSLPDMRIAVHSTVGLISGSMLRHRKIIYFQFSHYVLQVKTQFMIPMF